MAGSESPRIAEAERPRIAGRPALEELWRSVYENPRIGIALATADGRLVATNARYRALVGYSEDELRSMSFIDLTHPDDLDENLRLNRELTAGRAADFQFEKRYQRKDGGLIWVRTSVSLVPGPEKVSLALVEEITERKRAEDDLRTRERQLREAQALAHLGSWEWDPRGDGVAVWSDELRRIFGVGPEFRPDTETFLAMVHPSERDGTRAALSRSLDETDAVSYEYRIVRPDGQMRIIRSASFVERDVTGKMTRVVGVARDVTEERVSRNRLDRSLSEVRALSARLEDVRDEEAGRIARQVHDDVGQSLTALAMDVAWLRKRLGRRGSRVELDAKLEAMGSLVEATIDSVQRISSDLRPRILDELGLDAAAEWAVRTFEARTGLQCRFGAHVNGVAVEKTRATAAFRILQEALTNVARHARATRVDVRLSVSRVELRLIVRDDGLGIERDRLSASDSLGLIGMRERALSLGGIVTIERGRAGGTMVCARLPLTPADE